MVSSEWSDSSSIIASNGFIWGSFFGMGVLIYWTKFLDFFGSNLEFILTIGYATIYSCFGCKFYTGFWIYGSLFFSFDSFTISFS